ncbi:MAG: hypothetical protein AAB611_00290 [Patescibacteria group bacterium]
MRVCKNFLVAFLATYALFLVGCGQTNESVRWNESYEKLTLTKNNAILDGKSVCAEFDVSFDRDKLRYISLRLESNTTKEITYLTANTNWEKGWDKTVCVHVDDISWYPSDDSQSMISYNRDQEGTKKLFEKADRIFAQMKQEYGLDQIIQNKPKWAMRDPFSTKTLEAVREANLENATVEWRETLHPPLKMSQKNVIVFGEKANVEIRVDFMGDKPSWLGVWITYPRKNTFGIFDHKINGSIDEISPSSTGSNYLRGEPGSEEIFKKADQLLIQLKQDLRIEEVIKNRPKLETEQKQPEDIFKNF